MKHTVLSLTGSMIPALVSLMLCETYPSFSPLVCNCNGHSECVNESVCINCTDNTKGIY